MLDGDKQDASVFAAMGIPTKQLEALLAPEDLGIWPENWAAVETFIAMMTQWREGIAGLTGLDYAALPAVMDILRIEDRAECFAGLRIMELEALQVFRQNAHGNQ